MMFVRKSAGSIVGLGIISILCRVLTFSTEENGIHQKDGHTEKEDVDAENSNSDV